MPDPAPAAAAAPKTTPTAAAQLAAAAQPTTKTFTVAPRRELTHGIEADKEKRISAKTKNYVEGDTIELPFDEGKALQDLGFLVKDDGSTAVPTGGPATSAGVEIKEV